MAHDPVATSGTASRKQSSIPLETGEVRAKVL